MTTTLKDFVEKRKQERRRAMRPTAADGFALSTIKRSLGLPFWSMFYDAAIDVGVRLYRHPMAPRDALHLTWQVSEFYSLVWFLLLCVAYTIAFAGSLPLAVIAVVLPAYRLIELYSVIVQLHFCHEDYETASRPRALVGLMADYFQVALAFGIFYLVASHAIDPEFWAELERSWINSMYFSVASIATIGYGDLHPTSPMTKTLVIFEVLTGLLLLSMVIQNVLSAEKDPVEP